MKKLIITSLLTSLLIVVIFIICNLISCRDKINIYNRGRTIDFSVKSFWHPEGIIEQETITYYANNQTNEELLNSVRQEIDRRKELVRQNTSIVEKAYVVFCLFFICLIVFFVICFLLLKNYDLSSSEKWAMENIDTPQKQKK